MPVTLRDQFGVAVDDGTANQIAEQARADNMWAPARGYQSGRITTDLNAALVDEAAARAANNEAAAQEAVARQQALQQRQQMYAPRVGRVEDIRSLSDAASWAGTQMGQGVASMQDPLALAAAGQAVGTVGKFVPGLRGLSALAPAAGALGAFGLNQRQMAGEFYGNLKQDPTALARLTPQEANLLAQGVGAAGGALDTIVPGLAGRALGGAALHQAAGRAASSLGGHVLRHNALEGATEVGQGEIGRQALNYLNPGRDTGGDWSDRLNEFAGAAVGATPVTAAGGLADRGYGRVGGVANAVKDKAGAVVDMASNGLQTAGEAAKTVADKTGLKGVIDLGVRKGKDAWERVGEGGLQEAAAQARERVQKFRLSTEEADVLTGRPPPDLDEAGMNQWFADNDAARMAYVFPRLEEMAAEGHPDAERLMGALESDDPVTQAGAIDQASALLMAQNDYAQSLERAAEFKAGIDRRIKGAGALAAKGLKTVGKAAFGTAKNLAQGVQEGLQEAPKKNLQGTTTLDYDTWKAWRDENAPTPSSEPGSTHAIQRAALGRRALKEHRGEVPVKTDPVDAERSRQRATLFAELLAAEAKNRQARQLAHRVDADAEGVADYSNYVRSLGYELADMAESWAGRQGRQPTGREAGQLDVATALIDSMAGDLRAVMGDGAGDAVQTMAAGADPAVQPFLEYLGERVDGWQGERQTRAQADTSAQNAMLAMLPQAQQAELLADDRQGVRQLQRTVEMIARGRMPPDQRAELERALGGKQVVLDMLQLVRPEGRERNVVDDTATGPETANADRLSMDDDGEVSLDPQAGAFEQRQAERKLSKSAGPTMYMFEGQKSHTIQTTDSTRRDARNPFDSATELTAIQRAKIDEDAKALGFTRNDLAGTPLPSKPRPRLVEADNVDDARAKLGGKIAQFEANLKNSSPQHIDVVSAKEVLDGMNMQPAARLALFRDYMFQNARRKARSEQNPDPVGAAEDVRMAIQAHALVVESMRSQPGRQSLTSADLTDGGRSIEGWIKKNLGPEAYTQFVRGRVATIRASEGRPTRTYGKEQTPSAGVTEAERALVQGTADQFFANHYLVRAQEMTDRVPGTIAAGELTEMAKAGARKRSAVEGEIRLATDGADRNDQRDAMEGQLLNFAQPAGANLLGGKDTTLSIPTESLVGWVRKNRRQEADTEDKRNVNRRFMDDLFEGIATLTDSGMTEGMPWVNGPNGEKQAFQGKDLPGNLRLPTTTGAKANWGRQKRVEEAKESAPEPANRQERRRKVDVAREQARDEWFVTDPLIAATDNVTYREGREAHDVAVADYADRGGAVLSERAVGEGRTTRAGERLVSTPVAETTSASSNAVLPLDTKIGRREGGLDNALEESLYSRRALNVPAFESRNSKPALVADRAAGIIDKLRSEVVNQDGTRTPVKQDVAGALAGIRARLNTAARRGQEGGIQYAFPLAQVLNPDVLGMADLSMEQSRALLAMRSELSALLADSKDLKPYERTQLVKQMAGAEHAGKVNVTNAQRLLEKGAEGYRTALAETARAEAEKRAKIDAKQTKTAAPEVAAPAAPKSQPAPGGVKLSGKTPFTPKDQAKADRATKFIGRGSGRSSTAQYAKDFGARANSGQYTADDTVFVSAEGARAGRLDPDFGELGRALAARATIITDAPADRARSYNVGERQVAEFLAASGYEEKRAGEWSPKSIPPRPTSAVAKAAAFRKERQALVSGKAQESRVDTLAGRIANMALDAHAAEALQAYKNSAEALGVLRASGLSMAQALDSPKLQTAYAKLGALRLQGSQAAVAAMRSIQYAAEQHFALPVPARAEAASHDVIAMGGATLRQALESVAQAKDSAPLASILARAIVSVAGDTAIRHDDSMSLGSHGEYSPGTDRIRINPIVGSVATVVHEGAHAATVAAMVHNEGLHRAVYDLMDHVLTAEPTLAEAYGMTNSLEFLAEGLSNQHFQERLKQIKASNSVRKYLGETVANAWDAFVGLVRQALGLAPEHESALSQFLELSGRAMKETALGSKKGASLRDFEYRPVVSLKDFTQRVDALLAAPELAELSAAGRDELRRHLLGIADERGAPFPAAMGVEAVRRVLPVLKQTGEITAERIMDAVTNMGFGRGPLSLPSRLSTQVHNDLRRPGFAAAHDSPIRHGGEFNWREHTGKGEGNAAFGAGTYLSTDDGVHKNYKEMFTAAVNDTRRAAAQEKLEQLELLRGGDKKEIAKHFGLAESEITDADIHDLIGELQGAVSPTYHVSVNIMKAQLLNWDKPLSEQSSYVKKRLEGVDIPEDPWTEQWEYLSAAVSDGSSISILMEGPDNYVLYKGKTIGRFPTVVLAKEAAAQRLKELGLQLVPLRTGEEIYRGLTSKLGSQAAASDYLQSLGILGHEYAAEGGRNGERPNYVIYDDSKISTNYVHFNAQHVTNRPVASDADIKAAKDYVDKVLGPKIKTEFEAITGYSGEWIAAQDLIKVSTLTNAGVLNVARHEALHAFFGKFVKANPKAMRVLSSLTDDPRVLRRLQRLLKDEPAALAQLTDGEERLAYIHQFAMAGLLKLPHTPGTTLMSKIRKALRRVFQMVSDQERAVDLLYSFERGDFRGLEPSAAGRVIAKSIDQGSWASAGAKKFDGVMQRAAALALPANTILANSASPTARKLAKLFYTNPGEEATGKEAEGYLNARNRVMRRYDNHFRATIEELDDGQRLELINAMQNETATDKIADPEVALAKEKLHALFARFHRYMTDEKGLAIGKINENYFPVVWNPDEVGGDKFKQLLMGKYQPRMQQMADAINAANAKRREKVDPVSVTDVVDAVAAHIARENPLDEADMNPLRQDGVLAPWFASGHKRVLNFISPEDRAPFLEKNIVSTLSRYVRQGVRTAEYSSRFGRQGAKLHAMLNETKEELESASQTMLKEGTFKDEKARADWVRRQYRDVANATGAMEGSLGHDVSETVRKLNSWAIVYQNVRLLPLALFSSVVDPLGIAARGGDLRAAFETFARGMKAVAQQWGDMIREQPAERQKDQWEKLAEHAGVIDGAIFSHLLADEYGSTYHDNTARRVNETMFKANGMEPWNRAMRIGATRSAVRFIERHAKLPEEHSARWMAELGLDPRALPMDSEGHLITDKRVLMSENPDMENDAAEAAIDRVHAALVRWVEGAILSPNAAQRPAWGSDPHYSMFFHLKQFSYSFHETLIKRAVNEAKHGNVLPLGMFAWYIPAMIAADVTKGLMLGAGELPNYMKGYDLGDWMLHGVNRAGVLGYAGLAGDTAMNPLSVAGPMAEQAWDAIMDPVERTLVRAMPANALYSRALL